MTSEFWKRVAFTLGALLVFRLGSYIPLPGIDLGVWEQIFNSSRGGILQSFNAASGGAVERLSVFALGITPYVAAAIIVQLVSFFLPRLRALRDSGEAGRRRIETFTRALTLAMAALQGWGIALAIQEISGLVPEPGPLLSLAMALSFAGGTMFLVWLARQITLRGIGNGIALLLCAGIVMELPRSIGTMLQYNQMGHMTGPQIAGIAAIAVLLVTFAALMEKAQRRVPVTYGLRADSTCASDLVFKLNGAGIMPALLASTVLSLAVALIGYLNAGDPGAWANTVSRLQPGHPLYMACYAVLIFLCVFFYVAQVLDPAQAAETLKRLGGAIPQVEAGEPTAAYLDSAISRATLLGALYFVAICLIPELLLYRLDLPVYLGGTSLLVLVCTVVDIEKQARAFAHTRGLTQ